MGLGDITWARQVEGLQYRMRGSKPWIVSQWVSLPVDQMNNTTVRYFEAEDVLHIVIADGPESWSIELSPIITVELDANNEMIGVEILEASSFLRHVVLESIQARTLRVLEAERD